MSLREELLAQLDSWGVDEDARADDHASLIASGMLDSVALFNLSLWVEEKIGGPLDPTSFDLAREWDTIASILRFIERRTGQAAAPDASVPEPAPAAAPAPAHPPTPVPSVAAAPAPAVATPAPARRDVADHGYEIVRYEPRYLDELAELQTALWSADPAVNRAVFKWKYEDNPFIGEPLVYLALAGGKVVGTRAFGGTLWEIERGAPPVTLYAGDDLIIADEHRSQGLFARFTRAALADLRALGQTCFVSLSALRVTRLQSLASGSRSIGTLAVVGRVTTAAAVADRLRDAIAGKPGVWRLSRWIPPGGLARDAYARLDKAQPRIVDGVRYAVRRDVDAPAMAALVLRLGHDGRIRHVRDARFFAWRYRHPLHEYRVVTAERDGELVGYLIVERGLAVAADPRRVNIVDWEGTSGEVRARLLEATIEWGAFPDLVTWGEAFGGDRLAALQRQSFAPTDLDQAARGLPCILVRAVPPNDDAEADFDRVDARLLDLANWDMRMAYTSYV